MDFTDKFNDVNVSCHFEYGSGVVQQMAVFHETKCSEHEQQILAFLVDFLKAWFELFMNIFSINSMLFMQIDILKMDQVSSNTLITFIIVVYCK